MKVAGYELYSTLGEGRTGRVFQARPDGGTQEVAFRQVRPDLAQRQDVAEDLAALPQRTRGVLADSFVPVLAAFEADDALCVVEPFVDGVSLSVEVEQGGALGRADRLELALELVDALAILHQRGLVHGDVQAGNILLTGAGPRLVGFGVVVATRCRNVDLEQRPDEPPDGAFDPEPWHDVWGLAYALREAGRDPGGLSVDGDEDPLDKLLEAQLDVTNAQRCMTAGELRHALRSLDGAAELTSTGFTRAPDPDAVEQAIEEAQAASEEAAAPPQRAPSALWLRLQTFPWRQYAPHIAGGAGLLLVVALVAWWRATAPDTPEGMVQVPAGTDEVGDASGTIDQRPGWAWSHPRFFLDQHEVSREEYLACEAAGECSAPGITAPWSDEPALPAVGMSWIQAAAYCRWVGKRLPTENEWEAAARHFDGLWPWGDSEPTCEVAVFGALPGGLCFGQDSQRPQPAATAGPGPAHLAGNVWEWVDTDYHPYRRASSGDEGGEVLKVIKGGAWSSSPDLLSAAARMGVAPDHRALDVGLRCALDAPE